MVTLLIKEPEAGGKWLVTYDEGVLVHGTAVHVPVAMPGSEACRRQATQTRPALRPSVQERLAAGLAGVPPLAPRQSRRRRPYGPVPGQRLVGRRRTVRRLVRVAAHLPPVRQAERDQGPLQLRLLVNPAPPLRCPVGRLLQAPARRNLPANPGLGPAPAQR